MTSRTVIITGGGGFLGQCLASYLLEDDRVDKLLLVDIRFPETLQPAIQGAASGVVTKLTGDVSDVSFTDSVFAQVDSSATSVSIFHLGAVMSGDGERDFDLCMRVNLYGSLNMLEGARSKLAVKAKFIFTSAGATIGSGADTDYITKDDVISDGSRATPHTTYGATKACCELLLSDYARRGFVDGRALRLPTIVVRAGAPNAATTGCFSGVIREPLNGVPITLPIARDVLHAVTGTRAAIHAMVTLHDVELERIESVLGYDRTVFLPAVALSLGDLQDALYKVVTLDSQEKLGKITYEVDETLSSVVGSFPTKIDASRALALGIPPAPNAEELVRQYISDFGSAVVSGIEITPEERQGNVAVEKVAIITGAGSGIGRAVAERLSEGGWAVVLAGRRMKTLRETESLLNGRECTCIPTDVTIESEVDRLFTVAEDKYGHVDLLFNNAGINSTATSFENVSFHDFERVIKTNVCGPFLCARAAMRVMGKHGGGRIINNGSISAHVPRPWSACYTSSKHAVLGLTKCIALDGRSSNVACGQIDFGNVVSEMSLRTNKANTGALQANGTMLVEPSMSLKDAAETFMAMANLPLEANILQTTVMATQMPFVGRG